MSREVAVAVAFAAGLASYAYRSFSQEQLLISSQKENNHPNNNNCEEEKGTLDEKSQQQSQTTTTTTTSTPMTLTANPQYEKYFVSGLKNVGNSCFVNTVVQALSSSPSFYSYIEETVNATGNSPDSVISNLLLATAQELATPLSFRSTLDSQPLIDTLFGDSFTQTQQDAHEFLQYLSSKVKEEHEMALRGGKEGLSLRKSPLIGLIGSLVVCTICGNESPIRTNIFDNLSLALPLKANSTLQECLAEYVKPEKIDDYTCPKCSVMNAMKEIDISMKQVSSFDFSKRSELSKQRQELQHFLQTDVEAALETKKVKKVKSDSVFKQTKVTELPQVLCLHLNRITLHPTNGKLVKNKCQVSYPEILNPAEYQLGRPNRDTYKLIAVVVHIGTSHEKGHYIVFRNCSYLEDLEPIHVSESAAPTSSMFSTLKGSFYSSTLGNLFKDNSDSPSANSNSQNQEPFLLRGTSPTGSLKGGMPETESQPNLPLSTPIKKVRPSSFTANSLSSSSFSVSSPALIPRSKPSHNNSLQPTTTRSGSPPNAWMPPAHDYNNHPSNTRSFSPFQASSSSLSSSPVHSASSKIRSISPPPAIPSLLPQQTTTTTPQLPSSRSNSAPTSPALHPVKLNSGFWLRISDSDVRVVSQEEVFQSPAYLLFYERVISSNPADPPLPLSSVLDGLDDDDEDAERVLSAVF